ncbi:MAG: M56 family metallopeptidase [Candidatus Pedobacter colombiensis]|uniref:M56 family metallopeptidase n=1 Tax=Candidatus Pedobacter colombiensis TaxID=3121371 RepID=A0AAJ5W8Z0_9SPHI|nr:M56 family metallopeptidase [Pedobacter sp.]WEK20271.1 MAG: M56 family metallopeptidase [Pedobacter sp.]
MEAIVNNLIKATGWSIFHSLWQAAIIYGLLLFLVAILPRITAKLKHNLAYGAMCIMFASFVITFFYTFKWPTTGKSGITVDAGHQIINSKYLSVFSESLSSRTEQFFPYLVSTYAIGLLFQLVILSVGYRKLHLLKQSDKKAVPLAWQAAFDELFTKLNLRQQIGFYLSEHVNMPLVVGYFKPVVLFPIALVAQLDIKQVEAILIHELSHIRRNDYLLNLIKTAIETIMFFNPFVWLSGKFINIEREHACDDLVLELTGTPLTYAHALLKLEILKDKSTPALSMAASGKQQHLYQRIKRITDMKTNYRNAKQQLFATMLAVVAILSLAWISPTKTTAKDIKPIQLVITKKSDQSLTIISPSSNAKYMALKMNIDTSKKKHKTKIICLDGSGIKKKWNDTTGLAHDFQFNIDSTITASLAFLKSPKWQEDVKRMAENFSKNFDAKVIEIHAKDFQKDAEKIEKYFKSAEWKKQQHKIEMQANQIELHFNSPEFKKNIEKQIEKAQEEAKKAREYTSSAEYKRKINETKALENSAAYKELKKKFDADVEAIKKKNTHQTDSTSH